MKILDKNLAKFVDEFSGKCRPEYGDAYTSGWNDCKNEILKFLKIKQIEKYTKDAVFFIQEKFDDFEEKTVQKV